MDRRTKILAVLFGGALVYALFANVLYPSWIKPWLTLDERIAAKELERDKLLRDAELVDRARTEYRELVGRIGSFHAAQVESDVRARLNSLIEKYMLEDANLSPSRPVEDRKTGLVTTVVTLSAVGNFEGVVQFLREVAEFPHVARLGNVTLYPTATAKKLQDKERVSVRAPIELLVLPQNKLVGALNETMLTRLDQFPRHENRDYSQLWARKPFSDHIPPVPLRANVAQRQINVQVGAPLTLQGSASGGDGSYRFEWSPVEGLSNPTIPTPTVDTSKPLSNKVYTLSVTDGTGHTEKTTVNVTVTEPPKPETVVEKPPPPPPPDPGPKRWTDGKYLHLSMALMRRIGDQRVDEFMVSDTRNHENKYYKVGDEFDGGRLIFVHQRGGLVHRKDGYWVYPLGSTLEHPLPAAEAGEFPELKEAAERHKQAVEAEAAAKRAAAEEAARKAAVPGEAGADPSKAQPHEPAAQAFEAPPAGLVSENALVPSGAPAGTDMSESTGPPTPSKGSETAEPTKPDTPPSPGMAVPGPGKNQKPQGPAVQPKKPGEEEIVPNPNRGRTKSRPWRSKQSESKP